MKSILAITASTLAVLATPALAQDVESPEAAQEDGGEEEIVVEGEVDDGDVEVCRQIRITGTRFRETVCMTRNEQEEQRQNNRDVVNDHRYEGAPYNEYDDSGFPMVPPI